ncbi:HAMP domain-containing sensor histidine kinase [Nocardia sp. NPDC005366]|uniref:sensor histidine kinase n=1 Tax=Nocardia sp. NPDC005366 TaxID=3156878 RepID=UPI0033A37980
MRSRLLMAFTVFAAICLTGFAVGIGGELASSRTRGLMIDRMGDADRFAALSVDDPSALSDEVRSYYERNRSGVLIIDAEGAVRCDLGVNRDDPAVVDVIERARRFEPTPMPETLYPWHRGTMLVARPVGAPPVAAGVVVIAVSTFETTAVISDGWIQLACVTATALLVFGGLALLVSGWILRPVSGLLRAVDALTATLPASGGQPRRTPSTGDGPREILELAAAVEALTHAVAEFATAERRNVADTAHSMRNPLAALAVRLEALHPVIAGGGAEVIFDSVVSEVDRLTAMLDGLLAVAVADAEKEGGAARSALASASTPDSTSAPAPTWCDAVSVARNRVDAWRAAFVRAGMDLTIELAAPTAAAKVSGQILTQILDVALSNSSRYAGTGSWATVAVNRESDSVVVSVRDTGVGVPEEEIDRLTTRFFRGANAAPGGSGLGLPIAATLAGQHGGLFFIESADPHGLIVTVSFPAASGGPEIV